MASIFIATAIVFRTSASLTVSSCVLPLPTNAIDRNYIYHSWDVHQGGVCPNKMAALFRKVIISPSCHSYTIPISISSSPMFDDPCCLILCSHSSVSALIHSSNSLFVLSSVCILFSSLKFRKSRIHGRQYS